MRITRINHDSPDSELGVRFLPTDEQLISYLIKFVASNHFICNNIQFEDLYGSKKPWELMEAGTKYFFTQLKKLEPNHKRFIRTLVGGGSWKGQDKGKPVGAKKFGIKKTYNYEENKKDGKDEVNDVSWIMKEYSLDDKGPNASGYGDQLPQQLVKPLQNIESGYVGCDDEKMNDITTQPQWPNESAYGDQPQQMVNPIQNIESGYVGCDDEKMNDITTQPQWPNESAYGDQPQQMVNPIQNIESGYVGYDDELMNNMTTQPQWLDDYQLSKLIVTCPMVQGSSATMNEGNINAEFVVPEQSSTYHEEQVQNVEETADYQVDPTFTGVLNNDECLLIDELGDFDDFMGENQVWLSELVS
uniref:NAC transcription factor n=1 Tax=Solanum tuberosum TaxID=4113 RepID=M1AEN1_SOLTU